MFDFSALPRLIEANRYEDQQFSYPFIVRGRDGSFVIAWFILDISGPDAEHLFAHIREVLILDEEGRLDRRKTALDVPFALTDDPPFSGLDSYLPDLEALSRDFSEEAMNRLLQDKAYKPLFRAYQAVRGYVRACRGAQAEGRDCADGGIHDHLHG